VKGLLSLVVITLLLVPTARGQEKPAAAAERAVTPVRVQIVLIRQQGTKELSRLPFTVAVNANDGGNRAAVRMGAEVPVKATTFAPSSEKPTPEGKPAPAPFSSYSYRSIGTNIDCGPVTSVDGRYRVTLSIEDSSVYPESAGTRDAQLLADAPSFRSFRTSTTVALRDGETTQFTAATDRINGEVVRVEVTLNVVK
jgi:hypothetical protein